MARGADAHLRRHERRPARRRARLAGCTALCTGLCTGLWGALTLGAALCLSPGAAEAEPQGSVVVGGAVDISRSGTHTEFTQRSQTALLNHRSFDIGVNESVNFAQPSASALAVNRVVGSDLPTSIAGKLTANGNVWVLNPSGVAIRGTAQVNVGGLLATTASISDAAILAGERTFAGAPAGSAVTNAGSIAAGQGGVVLVAPVVSNTGSISTHGSDVALGAGSGFTVDFDGDGLTRFEVAPGSGVSVTSTGTIAAAGGAALISAASADAVQDSVVSIGGRIEATRAENRGGVIVISGGERGVTEIGGVLDARQSAGDGGRIAVTGERVDIAATAALDASGAASGGSIAIGGALRGAPIASPVLVRPGAPESAPLPTARRTVVRPGARLAANAGAVGDGGSVIVWADEATGFAGAIEARGGALAGDGGFAEVSGRQGLSFAGAVDLSAPKGAAGTLVLDPDHVTIVADHEGGSAQDGELLDQLIDADDPPSDFAISAGAVAAAVAMADTLIEARLTITQQADVTLSGANSLAYRTEIGDITLNAGVIGLGNALIIEAGGDVFFADAASRLGSLQVGDSASIGQNAAGGLTVTGTTVLDSAGDIALGLAANDFASVDLSGGAVALRDVNALQLGNISATGLTVAAGGAISQRSGTTISVPGDSVIGTNAGGIALTRPTNDFADAGSGHTVTLAATGAIGLVDTDSVALGPSSGAGLAVTADDLSIAGALDFAGTVTLTNGAGDFVLLGDVADLDGASFEVSDAELALIDAQRIAIGTSGAPGIEVRGVSLDRESLTLSSGAGPTTFTTGPSAVPGALAVTAASIVQDASAALEIGGKTTLAAGGTITLANAGNNFGATGEIDATGTAVTLVDRGAIALGTISATSLAVGAGGAITDTPGKAVRVTGPTDLAAQDGGTFFEIALDNVATHDFGGRVNARGSGIVLRDTNAITLGALSGSGLTVGAGGAITDTGGQAILVTGATGLSAGGGAADILLDNPALHDFGGSVSALGRDVVLNDGSAIALGAIDAATLGAGAGGAITDTPGDGIRVSGAADLVAERGGTLFDIVLDGNGSPLDRPHDFATLGARGHNVVLHDLDAIRLGAIVAASSLTVRAGGGITDTPGRAILVGGTTELAAEAGGARFEIALDNAATHDFAGRVDARGGEIALDDRSAIALGTIDAATLAVGAGGAIADTPGAAISVAGPAVLVAASGGTLFDVALDNQAVHDFAGRVDARGANIVLDDANAIALGAITVASGLTVSAGGAIADTPGQAILVGGPTDLAAARGAVLFDIALDNRATHDFGGPLSARGAGVALEDASALALGTIDAASLTIGAGGPISDTPGAAIEVAGPGALSAEAGGLFFDIALDGNGQAFDRPHGFATLDARGANVSLHDRNGLALGAIGATNLTVSAGGSITDLPGTAIRVAGVTDLLAQTGAEFFDIALDGDGAVPFDRPHDFGVVHARGEDITLHDSNAIVLGVIDANESGQGAAGDLTVRAGGRIGSTGVGIDVEGRTRLEARDGELRFDIALGGPNDFDSNPGGPDAAHEVDAIGANVTLGDLNAVALGAIAATDLTVAAGGSITDTPGKAILAAGTVDLAARNGADFFDIALDNPGTHDLGSVRLTGEGIRALDRRDLTVIEADSLADASPDATLPGDGIYLQVDQGGFAFAPGQAVPLDAVYDITLFAPGGSFDADPDPSVADQRMPDGLTLRSALGSITLDLRDGFVIEDVPGTPPFTLDAPNGISRLRIGQGGDAGAPQFFGIGTADFLEQAREPGFNPFFNLVGIGDIDLFNVTGDFALVARAPLTIRVQNTSAAANTGTGTVIVGTTYLGGRFAGGISIFGTFADFQGELASIEGFRDAAIIGELPYVVNEINTVNGCTILVVTACQPIGSLLPNIGYREGLLLGIKFVAPGEDLDDPFTNRGDEEGWE